MGYSTYHANNFTVPEWALRCFPQPYIVAEFPDHGPECLCSWAYAPDITGTREYPFIIKMPSRMCNLHGREYYNARGSQAGPQEPKARQESRKVPAVRSGTSQGKKQPRKSPKARRIHTTQGI